MGLFINRGLDNMNLNVKPTLFEFKKNSQIRKEPKTTNHKRFRTHLNLNKLRNFEDLASPKGLSPVKNLALAFTERKTSSFAVCEVREVRETIKSKGSPVDKDKTNRIRYFKGEKSKAGLWINERASGLLTPASNSIKSVQKIIQQLKKDNFLPNRRKQISYVNSLRATVRTSSHDVNKFPNLTNQNCASVQTDDF
jgi:hypothetical protein